MLRLLSELRMDSKEVEGGRCMRGIDGMLCFIKKERGKAWKDCMEIIMNDGNY